MNQANIQPIQQQYDQAYESIPAFYDTYKVDFICINIIVKNCFK